MDEILAFIPDTSGTIIDIDCGLGETTRYLQKFFTPDSVTGVATTQEHRAFCTSISSQGQFLLSKPHWLKIPSNSVDNAVFVKRLEGITLDSRLLEEIYRCLKPGGSFVALETIVDHRPGDIPRNTDATSGHMEDYRSLLSITGFREIRLFDVTKQCLDGFKYISKKRRSLRTSILISWKVYMRIF